MNTDLSLKRNVIIDHCHFLLGDNRQPLTAYPSATEDVLEYLIETVCMCVCNPKILFVITFCKSFSMRFAIICHRSLVRSATIAQNEPTWFSRVAYNMLSIVGSSLLLGDCKVYQDLQHFIQCPLKASTLSAIDLPKVYLQCTTLQSPTQPSKCLPILYLTHQRHLFCQTVGSI